MATKDIISKLKEANLLGRGGAAFPTGLKWEMVKNAKGEKKYIICNGSEGEPGVFKDGFILKNYPDVLIEGIKIALNTINNSSAFIYLRKDYYESFGKNLKKLIGNLPISFFKKPGGYLCGEETTLLQSIEKKAWEPRCRPPYPPQSGLWNCPTLVNNVETFYYAAKIARGEYRQTRFYSISGDVKNKGVFELPENYSISQILKETKNLPDFDFFVQAGGGASGEILLSSELEKKVGGAGAIIVYNFKKTNLLRLMKKWADFFHKENCDKCVPCREGVYRILEMVKKEKIDKELLEDLFFVLENTSFCPLGRNVAVPFKGLVYKLLTQ